MELITILVVDDSRIERQNICNFLRKAKFLVIEADNGKMGIRYYEQYSPHIVITDIYMPEVDGIEFIKQIRKQDQTQPILAVSSNREYLEVAIFFGASRTLDKPVQNKMLLDSIGMLLK